MLSDSPASPRKGLWATVFRPRPDAERASALKERVYASFTGLAIVTVFALDAKTADPAGAFFALLAGIVGITLAGFVAELISHLVTHRTFASPAQLRTVARISAGAIGSASIPLLVLGTAWTGIFSLQHALWVSITVYVLTLAVIALAAARRTGLPWRQQLVALGGLVGLGIAAVVVLTVAH